MGRKIGIGIALFLALFCPLLGGCGSEVSLPPSPTPEAAVSPTPTPVATEFALGYDPDLSLHPTATTSSLNLNLAPLLYEGLFALDETFGPVPVLCQSFSMEEGAKRWTFTLRAGVTFSDGTPLTAEAARGALLTAMEEGSLYATRLSGIASVSAEDAVTLTVSLKAPNVHFPALLDVPIFSGGEAPAGTGPYVLSGDRLVARGDWWQGAAVPRKEIPLRKISTPDDLIYAFDAGDIGLVTADLTGNNTFGYAGNYDVWEYPTTQMLYVGYETKKGLCQDPALRHALTLGYDRATVSESLLAGHAVPAALPRHPDGAEYANPPADSLSYSMADLAAELDGLGYVKNGEGLRYKGNQPLALKMIVSTDNGFKVAVAEALVADFSREGVQVTLEKCTWEEYLVALQTGAFDLYLGEIKMTADFDPTALIAPKGALNYGKFVSKPMEEALAEAQATDNWMEFYLLWSQECPYSVLCFKSCSVLTQWGRVRGATPLQGDLFHDLPNWKIS